MLSAYWSISAECMRFVGKVKEASSWGKNQTDNLFLADGADDTADERKSSYLSKLQATLLTFDSVAHNLFHFDRIVMSYRYLIVLLVLTGCFSFGVSAQPITDLYKSNQTVTWQQAIEFYQQLDEQFEEAGLIEYGKTDVGKPLHLFLLSGDGEFSPSAIQSSGKSVLLINNGIHPGEPCGIDASINLANDILNNVDGKRAYLDSTIIGIIPVYNVGGALNRGCCNRANQNGPEMQGFRGNARNLDLNRDFIKSDSRNAQIFARIFHHLDPDIFVDTHSTNGADYQHTMTLISTQHNKLSAPLDDLLMHDLRPFLYRQMEQRGDPMTPYVYTMGETPEDGIKAYHDSPRYSTGYTALFSTISFVSETHMFKPYPDRVESTYRFLDVMLEYVQHNGRKIQQTRLKANHAIQSQQRFPLQWKLDTTEHSTITFKGYQSTMDTSSLTGLPLRQYHRDQPYTKQIPFYNTYQPQDTARKPTYYILPQAWHQVIERLKLNQVQLYQLAKDTTLNVELMYIEDVETINRAYEGHYFHRSVDVREETMQVDYYAGDYIIPTGQTRDRYIVETLDPRADDSFFRWNFFDELLMRKEYFSPYIFEEKAQKILNNNPDLRKEFEDKQRTDSTFAQSNWQQLNYIYKHSRFYEDTHRRYPVGMIHESIYIPIR